MPHKESRTCGTRRRLRRYVQLLASFNQSPWPHFYRTSEFEDARWATQFTYGFPLVGNLSQTGVYPRDMDVLPAPPVGRIWAKSSERFSTMAKHSGYLHSRELRGKDLKQVELGWMGEPLPIDTSRNVLTYGNGSANIAFRFSVGQDDKLRACDDLKHNHVKLYCSVWTPIKLPTWDHIAQMRLGIKEDLREWPFFKADHESA